ncbi:transporter substrate-binding domain-containing protein [Pseudogemmobacter faecipullorum]|uniref:Transporter substrate-binding domain-containing protein n=1 Tax=Pseudogemmobacter faecipullorum TaxID=2755041 RepID=A0ABS8CKB2_9RHOB|nr:transporter substrate-binding domain-containing protein [Pseudogemmobacter faecipullorum]MCB5409814.1 transporter substrate-binding domain-containing protein [Pseudogemmobacter faecipullorum]
MKQKTLNFAAALTLAFSAPALAQDLKMGVDPAPYKPMSWQEADGSFHGFEVEVVTAACAAAGLNCQPEAVAWNGIIAALETSKIDIIVSSMSITPKRLEVVDFSDPYVSSRAIYIGHKDLEFDPEDPEIMGKVLLGVQTGTAHEDYLTRKFDGNASLKIYQAQDEQLADLVAGRVDVILAGRMGSIAFLSAPENADYVVLAEVEDESYPPLSIGAAFRKQDPNIEAFNKGLKTILDNGSYDAIAEKYFDFDVYGKPRG